MAQEGALFDAVERNSSRLLMSWGVAGVVMVVLMMAASSGPVRLWTNPSPDVDQSVVEPVPGDIAAPREPDSDRGRILPRVDGVWNTAAQVLVAVLVVGILVLTTREAGQAVRIGPLSRRRRIAGAVDASPEMSDPVPRVDVDAARAALSRGTPRNAIVGCWMQLERDATAVGLSRVAAETSSQYAERVVAESSVDAAPIAELAALYREARFSHHDLDESHRARAALALRRVVAGLPQRVEALT
ncbi:MAG: DUF4129 domain-containing protein [Acidimicrobiales bacterium]